MNENTEQHPPLHEPPPAAATTGNLGWEALEDEQPPAGVPSTDGRTVLHLPDKQRAWKRRRARPAAGATREPAPAGRHDGPSWRTEGVAVVLAACVGGAIALAITGQREHLRTAETPTSAKRVRARMLPATQRKHQRGSLRRARVVAVKLTPIRAHGDSGVPVLPLPPASGPAVSTAPSPAPVRQVDTEGQTPGGPFSP